MYPNTREAMPKVSSNKCNKRVDRGEYAGVWWEWGSGMGAACLNKDSCRNELSNLSSTEQTMHWFAQIGGDEASPDSSGNNQFGK